MAMLVNGERIEDEAIRAEAEVMRPEYEKAFADDAPAEREARLQEWAKENLIERTVLEQAAAADARPVPAEEIEEALDEARRRADVPQAGADQVRAEIERRVRIDRLLDAVASAAAPPSDEAVQQYYDEHRAEWAAPERVRASQMLRRVTPLRPPELAEAELREVLGQLRGGADFADLAPRHSDCPENGGDLGWFTRGHMIDEFEKVAWSLKPGETSDVFATRMGFHVVRVTEHRPKGQRGFDEVRDGIREVLTDEARGAAVEAYIDGLMESAKVEDA
ncbi:MAG: peptidylprolyl isomerase [Acidobacteria bacterium]|nr:peptidylprolyl isomerase [Acidobacteriota bacterium]